MTASMPCVDVFMVLHERFLGMSAIISYIFENLNRCLGKVDMMHFNSHLSLFGAKVTINRFFKNVISRNSVWKSIRRKHT